MPFDIDGFIPAQGAPAGSAFYNSNRDAPVDPLVPALIEDTSEIVQEYLAFNRSSATEFLDQAKETLDALVQAKFPEELPDPPAAPTITTSFNAKLGLGLESDPTFGDLVPEYVGPFTADPIDPPDPGEEPEFESFLQGAGAVSIPEAPTFFPVPEPGAPSIDTDLDVPSAPTPSYGGAPDLDEIVIPAVPTVALPVFGDTAPEFSATPPSPFSGWVEPQYTSSMKDAVAAVIQSMLAGGTGIPEDVERAIWERASDREGVAGAIRVGAAITQWAARGFPHAQGALTSEIVSVIGNETERKRNDLSRERAIAQAELEQKNRQFAVQQGLSYEQIFVGIFLAVIDRNFQIAKFAVESEIQVYNARVSVFNVQQQVFAQKLEVHKSKLETALYYLKVYSAQIEAEKAKAEVNEAKVRAFEARVRAYNSEVQAYGEVVKSVVARADLQRSKVDVYKAQIEGMIGKINGQRAVFEAYDSRVRGETAKVTLEETNARVYAEKVRAFGQRSETAIATARLKLDNSRMLLDWNVANMQRVTSLTGQQLSVIQSRLAAHQGSTQRAVAKYQADKESKSAELQADISISQMAIAKYQALMRQWEVRAQQVIAYAQMNSESLRTAGQMVTNLAAGAFAGTHVSAGISAGSSASQTSGRSSTDNTSQTRAVGESNTYSVTHNYQHSV